jgi:hypothetical protein
MCNVDARRGAWSFGTRGGNLARPEGFEHAPPTIVIKGVEALVEALRAA